QAENIALREHEHVPLFDIQRWAGLGGQALFDSILVFENYPVDAALRERNQHGLQLGDVDHAATTNYPLTLVVSAGETLEIASGYDTALFDHEAIERLQRHYAAVLQRLAGDVTAPVASLALPSDEAGRLVAESAAAAVDVLTAWQRNLADEPSAIALQVGDATLTRLQVDRLANAVAQALVARGVGVESTVGLCVERSFAFAIGWLGILKAGAAC
ncbi:AMP-binding protein, partial [Cupriavidus respiraculi]|uniref:condensation domain-containing protein n=1 Tax=Cupriavidus respiraculi TaxID=195930 RepID=UPI001C982651